MDNQSEQIFLRLVTAEVTQAIAQALETLIHEKGFEVPIHIASRVGVRQCQLEETCQLFKG